MYIKHFSLQCPPFRITPDPALFFEGGRRGEILDALIYAITTGEGIIKVVGEVGSGKTMLCRMLEERLPKSVEIVYLANPRLSPHDILYAIAFELGIQVTAETERLIVMQQLQAYLLKQHSAGRSVVVFIEEAQGMPLDTLEEIRLLSNLETHRYKLLQIVLFGQPELERNLRKTAIRQLRERITHTFRLPPLTGAETGEYIRFRLRAAGCCQPGVFSGGAEKVIARASRGLIRRINILADKAMLAAYAYPVAVTRPGCSTTVVRSRHARTAINDSEFNSGFPRPGHFKGIGLFAMAIILILVADRFRLDAVSFFSTFSSSHSAPQKTLVHDSRTETARIQDVGDFSDNSVPLSADPPEAVNVKPMDLIQHGQAESPRNVAETSGQTLSELRFAAAVKWLQHVDVNSYTIQLITVDAGQGEYVERFLQQISKTLLLEKVYVCPARHGERDMLVVVYNDFQGVTPARKAIEALPEEVRRFQPFLRSIENVLRAYQRTGDLG